MMKNLLIDLGFDFEDINVLLETLEGYSKYKIESIINLLNRYGCSKCFIRDLIINHIEILSYDIDVVEYKLESIKSNGDLIEDILVDIL